MQRAIVNHEVELGETYRTVGRGRIVASRGVKDSRRTQYTNQLSKTHRGSQRLKWPSWSLHRSVLGPLYLFSLWFFLTTPSNGSKGVSDSLTCWWDPFIPTGLPSLALLWEFMHSVNLSCYGVQLTLLASLFFFWRDMEKHWIEGRRETGRGKERRGRRGGSSTYSTMQDVLYKRQVKKTKA